MRQRQEVQEVLRRRGLIKVSKMSSRNVAWMVTALFALACAGDRPRGLSDTGAGTGPQVYWDLEAEPLQIGRAHV